LAAYGPNHAAARRDICPGRQSLMRWLIIHCCRQNRARSTLICAPQAMNAAVATAAPNGGSARLVQVEAGDV